jgi:hypothetical protein
MRGRTWNSELPIVLQSTGDSLADDAPNLIEIGSRGNRRINAPGFDAIKFASMVIHYYIGIFQHITCENPNDALV